MKAMILSAGRGERLRPLTDTVPKSLVEVGGKSLLERHLGRLQDAGIVEVVINLGWLGAEIVARIGNGSMFGLKVSYSDEGDDVLETGGGIHKALPLLGSDPFLVINADILTDMPVPQIELDDTSLGHLIMVQSPAYRVGGDFDVVDGRIKNTSQQSLTFSGVAVYRPELFDGCEAGRFSIVPILREAADATQLTGSLYEGHWADVGTPERLAAANQFF